eukprot:jgi/Tetstr1/429819/TSEL_019686.t1
MEKELTMSRLLAPSICRRGQPSRRALGLQPRGSLSVINAASAEHDSGGSSALVTGLPQPSDCPATRTAGGANPRQRTETRSGEALEQLDQGGAQAGGNGSRPLTRDTMTKERDVSDKYEVREQIGKGAFGAAMLVINREDKQEYVMKRVRLARQTDWQRKASFQEMELVGSLQHPFIVPHVESWVDRGHTINTVYHYCSAGDLGTLLQRTQRQGKKFSEEQLKTWLCQSLLALDYMHKKNVLHRDIKSTNLFITEEGNIMIGDFGLATFRDGGDEDDQSIVGTPHYMSPELLSKKNYSFKADIWSLGCVMYELTAQRPAFTAFNLQGLIRKIKTSKLVPITSGYSDGYLSILKSMLRKKPSQRPSADELLRSPALYGTLLATLKTAVEIQPGVALPEVAGSAEEAAMAAVKQRLEEEEEEESQSNEYSGASEDGEGASSHVEAVAEELARKINMGDLNMDSPAAPPRSVSPNPMARRSPRGASPTSPGRAARKASPQPARGASPQPARAADPPARQPWGRASPRAVTPPRTAWGNDPPQPERRSPRHSRPTTPPRQGATDGDRIFAQKPSGLSPRVASSSGLTAARCQSLEGVVALASRLHSAGRLAELGYLLAATAAQGNVGGCVDPHTAAERAMSHPYETASPEGAPFQLGDQVIVGNRRRLRGTIRYYGPTLFAEGEWVGMELEVPEGKNDGTVKGIHYFECKPNCGLFVKASILRAEEQ